MNGFDETPGIAEHLKTSRTVWDTGWIGFGALEFNAPFPPVSSYNEATSPTFFYGVRTRSYLRTYILGTSQVGPVVIPASTDAAGQVTPPGVFGICAPNTEEFVQNILPRFPLQRVKSFFVRDSFMLAVDEDGILYSCGNHFLYFKTTVASLANCLGHGKHVLPYEWDELRDQSSPAFVKNGMWRRNSPQATNVLQRVYGGDDSFNEVRFKQCMAVRFGLGLFSNQSASLAISTDGDLWMAGELDSLVSNEYGQGFDIPENYDLPKIAFPSEFDNNTTSQEYFKKRNITSYYSTGGDLVTGAQLVFDEAFGGNQAVAFKTSDGRLFQMHVTGHDFAGSLPENGALYEIGGFIENVTIVSGGSGYDGGGFSITVSEPESGRRAVLSATRVGGVITAIKIVDSGSGYTSAPEITITHPSGTGAEATCGVFEDTWVHAAFAGSPIANLNAMMAVSSSGGLYSWGIGLQDDEDASSWSYRLGPVRIGTGLNVSFAKCYARYAFDSILGEAGVFAAITAGGNAYFAGISYGTPDLENSFVLRPLSDMSESAASGSVVKVCLGPAVSALLKSDGSVWSWGRAIAALGHGSECGTPDATKDGVGYREIAKVVGQGVWKDIHIDDARFASTTLYAIRESEELDPMYGVRTNPLPPYESP